MSCQPHFHRLNILLGQSLRSWYCRPWTVGSYAAYLPLLRRVDRGTKRTIKRRPSRKHVENRTPKLRLQQRPWSCVGHRHRSSERSGHRHTTICTRRSWCIIASIWPSLNRPRACLRQSVPARGTQSRGLDHGNSAHRRQLLLGRWARHTQKALNKVRRPGLLSQT